VIQNGQVIAIAREDLASGVVMDLAEIDADEIAFDRHEWSTVASFRIFLRRITSVTRVGFR
jgi:hypothetical protein